MASVNLQEAQAHFSELLHRAAAGEVIIIADSGKPLARLVPPEVAPKRVLGQDRGLFVVPDDFDAPLPEEILRSFEG